MGYQRPLLKLVFADGDEFEGLEVRMRRTSIDQTIELITLGGTAGSGREGITRILEMIADSLVDWNLEEPDGTPVPATLDGLRRQDDDFIAAIRRGWQTKTVRVSPPLPERSSGGDTSLEASIPMETSSPSPTSSAAPDS